jgi:hypothetical protein
VFTLVFLKRCFLRPKHKLGVACDREVKVKIVVELVHCPPGTIPEHKLVIVLATAVIAIQVHTYFPNFVVGECTVIDDCAAAFACMGQLSF